MIEPIIERAAISTGGLSAADRATLDRLAGAQVTLLSGSADPSVTPGVAATQPALYFRSGGDRPPSFYLKTGAANTAWTVIQSEPDPGYGFFSAGNAQQRFTAMTGLVPQLLWIGQTTDRVVGTVLQAVGTPQSNGASPLNPSPLKDALFNFPTASDAWRAPNATTAELNQSLLIVDLFRATAAGATNRNIFGKRDTAGDTRGYEMTIAAAGQISVAVRGDALATNTGTTTGYDTGLWHLAALWFNFTARTYRWATLGETSPLLSLPAGSFVNTTQFAWNRNRVTGFPKQQGLGAIVVGAQVEAIADLKRQVLQPLAAELSHSYVMSSI